jgi:polyphosphate kinase
MRVTTALLYTDIGLFTADEQIAEDASAVFNLLTGYSQGHRWRKLIVAPNDLHRRTIELIDEQAELARSGRLDATGLFSGEGVIALLEADQRGEIDAAYPLLAILCLESWVRQFAGR